MRFSESSEFSEVFRWAGEYVRGVIGSEKRAKGRDLNTTYCVLRPDADIPVLIAVLPRTPYRVNFKEANAWLPIIRPSGTARGLVRARFCHIRG